MNKFKKYCIFFLQIFFAIIEHLAKHLFLPQDYAKDMPDETLVLSIYLENKILARALL